MLIARAPSDAGPAAAMAQLASGLFHHRLPGRLRKVGGWPYGGCVRFPEDEPAQRHSARHGRRPATRQPDSRQEDSRQPDSRQPAGRRPSSYQPAGRRPSDSVRYGRRRLVALLACVVVTGVVFWVGLAHHHSGGDHDPATSPGGPAATPRGPAASSTGLVLQVIPAPYQLPAGISGEVVLPSGALGQGRPPALMIAGGLTPASATTTAVTLSTR